jgi:hypothetical protein
MTPDELDKAIRKAENHVAFYTAEANRLVYDERPRLLAKVAKAEAAVDGARLSVSDNETAVAATEARLADAVARLDSLRPLVSSGQPEAVGAGSAFNASVRIEEDN